MVFENRGEGLSEGVASFCGTSRVEAGWVCEVLGGAPGKKRQNLQRLSPQQGLSQASLCSPSSKIC